MKGGNIKLKTVSQTVAGITTISPTARVPQLQDDRVHPYFLSVRGGFDDTAEAILSIAEEVGWDYLSTIYTDTMEYRSAKDALLRQWVAIKFSYLFAERGNYGMK